MIFHQDLFHCFSMYIRPDDPNRSYNNIWHAVSEDGVHWRDAGMAVGNAPFPVWAMKIHTVKNGKFIMNHGSFGASGAQNTLKFWESDDLYHWIYRPDLDIIAPKDAAGKDTRLDCMCVIESGRIYYGYATGKYGSLRSEDGEHFRFAACDFDLTPLPPFAASEGGFEVGDVTEAGNHVFFLGGGFGWLGKTGYGVFTFRADAPQGTFKPDFAALRLSGNSDRWVNLWARFVRCGSGLLSHSYMQEGYSYEYGDTWLPPLRRVLTDDGDHLRLCWWEGNERLKGERSSLSGLALKSFFADGRHIVRGTAKNDGGTFSASVPEKTVYENEPDTLSAVIADFPVDAENGVVIEGTLTLQSGSWVVFPAGGFYLEEDDVSGTAVIFDSCGRTLIYAVKTDGRLSMCREDILDYGCAVPCGMSAGVPHRFRLIIHRCMFEIYLDDMYVQTFNTAHTKNSAGRFPKRFGIASCNGVCTGSDITVYKFG